MLIISALRGLRQVFPKINTYRYKHIHTRTLALARARTHTHTPNLTTSTKNLFQKKQGQVHPRPLSTDSSLSNLSLPQSINEPQVSEFHQFTLTSGFKVKKGGLQGVGKEQQ